MKQVGTNHDLPLLRVYKVIVDSGRVCNDGYADLVWVCVYTRTLAPCNIA